MAQAVHWFVDTLTAPFYREADPVLRPGGLLAVWCYVRPRVDSQVDRVLYQLWHGAPRQPCHQMAETGYAELSFPPRGYSEVTVPTFTITHRWGRPTVEEYVHTWTWFRDTPRSDALLRELAALWPDGTTRELRWDLLVRAARKPATAER